VAASLRVQASSTASNLVDMPQQIGRIIVNADCTGLPQLVLPIATAQKTDTQGPASYCCQHVPDTITDNHCCFDWCFQSGGGREKQVRIGFGIFDLIARHHRDPVWIDAERGQIDGCGFHAAAGRNRPRNTGLRQPRQQFSRSRQRPDVSGLLTVRGGVALAQPFRALIANLEPGLAQKLVGEQAAAHADLAMDAPDR
jgi:hypothetical protein